MIIFYGIVLAALFFAVQLILCFKIKSLAMRLIPVYLVIAGFILCALMAVFGGDSSAGDIEIYAWQFALLLAIVPALAGVGDGIAWGIYRTAKHLKAK